MQKKPSPTPRKPVERSTWITLILLFVNTLLFFLFYRVLILIADRAQLPLLGFIAMGLYMALLIGFLLGYLIYNRFLYRKGLTADDLPVTMTPAEKEAFLEDGRERLRKSRWVMLILIPLLLTFFFDTIDLFIVDRFR